MIEDIAKSMIEKNESIIILTPRNPPETKLFTFVLKTIERHNKLKDLLVFLERLKLGQDYYDVSEIEDYILIVKSVLEENK